MISFIDPHISIAVVEDTVDITNLLNITYRGEASKQGWTTEAALIAGDTRADEKMVLDVIKKTGSVFLKFTNEAKQLVACVNLEQRGLKIYLGMFSVSPQLQGAGVGKQMLKASEEYTIHKNCSAIYMSVISQRTELIDWYKRHGYAETGERIPFEEDGITGKHLQKLEFMILEKSIVA